MSEEQAEYNCDATPPPQQSEYDYQATTPHLTYKFDVIAQMTVVVSGERALSMREVFESIEKSLSIGCQCYSETLQFSAYGGKITIMKMRAIDYPDAGEDKYYQPEDRNSPVIEVVDAPIDNPAAGGTI